MELKETVKNIVNDKKYKPMSFKQFAYLLDIKENAEKDFLREILNQLEQNSFLISYENKFYKANGGSLVSGLLQITSGGYGFVLIDNADDIFIPSENLSGALNGDEVLVQIIKEIKPRFEGRIVKIIKNNNKNLLGTFYKTKRGGYITADNKGITKDVYINEKSAKGAVSKDRVVFEIIKKISSEKLEGRVLHILGAADKKGVDIKGVVINNDIKYKFNEDAIKQADGIKADINLQDKSRVNLSKKNIFTIDALTAKDMDDAVNIELKDNNYVLGVHIADVSYYVKKNTPLDKEAYERGNSTYFPDYAIPMLPHSLSGDICSLRAEQPRLSVSVVMTIDKTGNVLEYEIFKSIIKSKKKMTYTGVQAVLDDIMYEDDDYKKFKKDILLMDELSDILNNRREKRGSIDFDMPEAEAIVDEEGNPILIKKSERLKSHKIIEEFMLLANETIAEHIYWLNYPCIYRVHDDPNKEKMADLKEILLSMGYKINSSNMHPKKISELLSNIKDKPEEDLIKNIVLRSMQRAVYHNKNTGHFGIAAKYYTHFTSPIRRYSDLIVHRILAEILIGNTEQYLYSDEELAEISRHISKTERISVKAEREVMRIKMAKYLSDKLGTQYKAVISHITSNGFFVELENLIEGFVPFSYLDDYYVSDLKRFLFYNERSGKTYKLGEIVSVKLKEVNIIDGRCIFVFASSKEEKAYEDISV